MKLKKLLEINQMCEERKAPWDVQESFEYDSESLGATDILDMDITHFVRAFKILSNKKTKELLANNIKNNKIDGKIHWISDQLSSLSKELKEYTESGD